MKKYFLIVGIGFLAACARQQDIQPIRDLPAEQSAPGVVNGKIVSLTKDANAKTVVSLSSRMGEGSANCTGTVIGARVILTAGHCLEGAKEVSVRFAAAANTPAVVAEWKIHPKYRKPEKSVIGEITPDLALIRLKNAIPAGVKIAKLGTVAHKFTLGQQVISYGYGFSEAGTNDFFGIFEWDYKDSNKLLNAGTFAIVASKDAGTKLKKSKLGLDGAVFVTHASKSSICQGDSGGPTFLTKTEEPTIVGVNSFITDGTCINAMNGLADLRFQRGWVDATIERWFPAPKEAPAQTPTTPQPSPNTPVP